MISLTCPVCGGKRVIRIGSDFAECGSCGNVAECDPTEMKKIRTVYRGAELSMKKNTVMGYREAIKALDGIGFVEEAAELSRECSRRLEELQDRQAKQQAQEAGSGKKSAALGVVLLVFVVLFCAALLFGAVYLIVRLVNGTLSGPALPIAIGAAVLALVLFFYGKSR